MKLFKSIISVITVFILLLSFSSCSATQNCEYDTFLNNLSSFESIDESDTVKAFVYETSLLYETTTVDNDLTKLFPNTLDKTNSINRNEKVLSITIGMQYEITIFADGGAMIYYGYCGVFQKDRQYYICESDYDVNQLVNYITENYTLVESGD